MAFVTVNGYDVEHASSMLVYENLIPEIQHINGKGVTDKFTPGEKIDRTTYVDVMRVLPYAPRFRQLGATNNGGFSNVKNNGRANAPQSQHFTVPVDLMYDEGVPITDNQTYSNPVELRTVVLAQIVKTAGLSINIITFAKQLVGFFRIGDNFAKGVTLATPGTVDPGEITTDEIAKACFFYDPAATGMSAGSPILAFENANASLDDGVEDLGAFYVPREERQAFITPQLNTLMKGQYAQNASEASARILATGFINPFNGQEDKRINAATGMAGMYDGVDLFIVPAVTRKFVYIVLGLDQSEDANVKAAYDAIQGMIVYGAGTCRGIVGPYVTANTNTYYGGVYILPRMKVGVECLHGASIKLLVNTGTGAPSWGRSVVAALINAISFTPIDGAVVTASAVGGFNDGTTV